MIGTTMFQSVVARITALKTALLDTVANTNGAGAVGFLYATAYVGNTLGAWLKGLASATGAGFVGRLQNATSAITRTLQAWT